MFISNWCKAGSVRGGVWPSRVKHVNVGIQDAEQRALLRARKVAVAQRAAAGLVNFGPAAAEAFLYAIVLQQRRCLVCGEPSETDRQPAPDAWQARAQTGPIS
jgi:hypothetical protein